MPLYFETDTHWNAAGAYRAFEMLFDSIKKKFPQTAFPVIEFTTEISYEPYGDIPGMSGFTSYGKCTIPDIHPVNGWESFYQYGKKEGNGVSGIITRNNSPTLPKAIIYRDSFFSSLEPFTSCIFSSAEYHGRWLTESEKDYILENKPDLIIWEMVERYLGGVPYSGWN
jgi:hypothetical protein